MAVGVQQFPIFHLFDLEELYLWKIPDPWNVAAVTPIHKKGSRQIVKDKGKWLLL